MTELSDWIAKYYTARSAYEEAKAASTQLYHLMQSAEISLVDAMIDEGVNSVNLDDGTAIGLRKKFDISVTKANTHSIREWLVEEVGDDMPFVEEVISKPALTAYLKDHEDVEPPDFLSLSTRPGISVRGWNTRPR